MILILAMLSALAQDSEKGLRDAAQAMDRSVDHLHKSGRGDGPSHLDRSILRQKEALEIIDEMLRRLDKGGG